MALNILAISAPAMPKGKIGETVLKSADPASLFNACRYAAYLADNGIGAWGNSNWNVPRKIRRESVLLINSYNEEISTFENLLLKTKPNLLLIGAMTLCFRGAVECAQRAKQIFGDKICIALGGRHPTEAIYLNKKGEMNHHPGSPLRLMAEGYIEPLFDLVISGEAEYLIAALGEVIDKLDRNHIAPSLIGAHLGDISQAPGQWILGWADDGIIHTITSKAIPIDKALLPPPCEMFGVKTSFDIFEGRLTAHVFSDSGRGCIYNCAFCSESRCINDPLQLENSHMRLFRQLQTAERIINEDNPHKKASAFVEDSIILGGSDVSLRQLLNLLQNEEMDLLFGGQLTIDQILNKINILRELKEVGLSYIFTGIETLEPESIGGISKNINTKNGTWLSRAEKVIETLALLGIESGVALLFGLGESQKSRVKLLQQIKKWQRVYGSPSQVSLNWAVQHPLKGNDGGTGYRYLKWAMPSDEWLEVFQDFGEASYNYPLSGQKRPILREVQELQHLYREILCPAITLTN